MRFWVDIVLGLCLLLGAVAALVTSIVSWFTEVSIPDSTLLWVVVALVLFREGRESLDNAETRS